MSDLKALTPAEQADITRRLEKARDDTLQRMRLAYDLEEDNVWQQYEAAMKYVGLKPTKRNKQEKVQ